MGIDMVSGRGFSEQDREDSAPVAIVNEEFVRRYLQGQDANAMELAFGYPEIDPNTRRPVIGVVDDVRYVSLSRQGEPAIYQVYGQGVVPPYRQSVVLATALTDFASLVPSVRNVVRQLDPQLVIDPQPVRALVVSTLARQRFAMLLMLVFGAIALVLSAVGIYGLIAFSTAQRTDEVATRLALGATSTRIFWMLTRQGGRVAIAGGVLGLVGAYIGGRLAATWLFEVRPSDPVVLVAGMGVVVIIALFATAISARRAARADPAFSLRTQA
jgi:putative ABC transport system permease protein